MLSREWRIGLGPGGVVLFMELAEFGRTLQWNANCVPKQSVESIDPEHLAGEHCADVARDGFSHRVQVEWLAECLLHRSDWLGRDAAGDDQVEEAEVGVDVEGETVRSD